MKRSLIFTLFVVCVISDKSFSQIQIRSVDDTINTFRYEYKLKAKTLKPKTQVIAYYNKAVQFALTKISSYGKLPAKYNVSKKVSTLTFDNTTEIDSIAFDVYRIKTDTGFNKKNTNSSLTNIQSYGIPFYKHPYTLYVTSLKKNEVLMMGVISAKGSISKEKDKLIREGVLYIKNAMEVPE